MLKVNLTDGDVNLAGLFIEFVWRYPKEEITQPKKRRDFFSGFFAQNSNCVIESVYTPIR